VTGLNTGVTTFHRKNPNTLIFETAGQIEWLSNSNANVQFGIDEVIFVPALCDGSPRSDL
jgi:hypothetical protein